MSSPFSGRVHSCSSLWKRVDQGAFLPETKEDTVTGGGEHAKALKTQRKRGSSCLLDAGERKEALVRFSLSSGDGEKP
jgi:hypothetical protein